MTTTLQDLIAQQAEIAAQLRAYEQPLISDAKAVLTGEAAMDLAATLTAIRDQLPDSMAKTHIGNVLTVLSAVPQVLDQELARVGGGQVSVSPMMIGMPGMPGIPAPN